MEQIATTEEIRPARPGLIATLRTFPRPVWVLCGGTFLNKFGTFVIPFLALYMTRQGFSIAQAGLAISAYGLGNFLASIFGLAFNAGWAFGPATAGFLAAHSFFWLFVGDAATSLLFGWVAWTALPRGVKSEQAQVKWSTALKHVASDRRLLQVLLASLMIAPAFFQISSTFGLQVTARGFSEPVYGMLISLNGVLIVLF